MCPCMCPYMCPYVCPYMCPYMCPYVCPYVCPYTAHDTLFPHATDVTELSLRLQSYMCPYVCPYMCPLICLHRCDRALAAHAVLQGQLACLSGTHFFKFFFFIIFSRCACSLTRTVCVFARYTLGTHFVHPRYTCPASLQRAIYFRERERLCVCIHTFSIFVSLCLTQTHEHTHMLHDM